VYAHSVSIGSEEDERRGESLLGATEGVIVVPSLVSVFVAVGEWRTGIYKERKEDVDRVKLREG
jgi:hypothetical protein